MNGKTVALDTNVAIALLNDSNGTGRWAAQFQSIYIPAPVVGELLFGALKSRRSEANLERIERLIGHSRTLDISRSTAYAYARIRHKLKESGKPIPENDVWIAAVCVQHELPLATLDVHFRSVDDLELLMPGA